MIFMGNDVPKASDVPPFDHIILSFHIIGDVLNGFSDILKGLGNRPFDGFIGEIILKVLAIQDLFENLDLIQNVFEVKYVTFHTISPLS